MAPETRPATHDEIPAVAAVLAEAFESDPVMAAMLPDPVTRTRRLGRLFATEVRHHHFAGGGVDIAVDGDGTIGGAAVWDPPGRWRQSAWAGWRMLPQHIHALGARAVAGARIDRAFERAHPAEPHWYLSMIGTAGAARGGGFGKALLTSRLAVADGEGMPAYLESSNIANVPYYERFGFAPHGEIDVVPARNGKPAVVAYAMWRDPR
ncbi:GNAT family N-acetyltransferase [Rhodococcus sp. HNM0569]|uniref:GNAT family N-acetyltransferase n=1 Tax=Rhodococcus sp. HNM0569 TaxID=2716340 RepID=UPI00146A80E5|nr:GNAT family N-acetyltransferase [Rhodococcus sp. HNM0569]NLU84014.1 GNAT family N-acetyltransferase [Rhodococcus sp. HNM0569]